MITANVLNNNAQLNSYSIQSSLEFVPGTIATLKLQLFDAVENLRYIPPVTAIVSVIFNNTDGTTLTKVGTLNADDRSLVTIALSATETASLFGGNALLSVDLLGDATQVLKGLIPNVLQKFTIDS